MHAFLLLTAHPSLLHSSSAFRNVFCAIACAGVLPMINEVGIVTTNGLTALLALVAFGYVKQRWLGKSLYGSLSSLPILAFI